MSKYVRGVKRNQIIQRWLQGIEDPEYEVFPTKKEGKYIVRLRESKLNDMTNSDIIVEDKTEEKSDDNLPEDTEPESKPTRSRRPQTSSSDSTIRDSEVHGINLEILEQLRNLGEEIRNDRFKKEQKQYIKQIVNKELNKSRIRSKYVPDLIPVCEIRQQENESAKQEDPPEPIYQEPQPEQPKFRSRIRR